MSLNNDIYELMVGHQIGLQRYSTGVLKKILAHLSDVEKDIIAQLSKTDGLSKKQLQDFLTFLRARMAEYRGAVNETAQADMLDLAAYEADYNAQKLSGATGTAFNRPSAAQLAAIVKTKPIQGRLLNEWSSTLAEATRLQIQDAVRIGVTEGEGTAQIIKRIRGTRANGYKDGVLQISRNNAAAVIRTMTNDIATQAREQVYAENEQFIDGVMWSSVLDARTTPVCQARDGEVYPLNEGPRPPAHIGCRSVTTAIIKGFPQPERTTYAKWLKKQPFKDQIEILGPTRAALFKAGGLSLDRFVDNAGRSYTLDELRKRDLAAFEKAGLTKKP